MMIVSAIIIQFVDCILNFPRQLIGFVEEGEEFVFHMLRTMIPFVNFGENLLQLFIDVRCFRQELFNHIVVKFFEVTLDYIKVIQSLFDEHRLIFEA